MITTEYKKQTELLIQSMAGFGVENGEIQLDIEDKNQFDQDYAITFVNTGKSIAS
ncbi:MAG: hypothetical protein ACQERZ_04775 [Fusobacteriota bacterium]